MPSHWLSVAIVAFWLSTTGWLVYQNVGPLLLPEQAPAYSISLEDEVQTQQAHIRWNVLYNGRKCLRAETWVEPNAETDTFALVSELHPLIAIGNLDADRGSAPFGGLVEIRKGTSTYEVTRQGVLRSVNIELSAVAHAPLYGDLPGQGTLTGQVRDGRFFSHLTASAPALPDLHFDGDLDPVPVSANGSILSPMHPVNRVAGLRPGQTWRVPLVDPVPMVVSALFKKYLGDLAPGAEEVAMTAHVLPERRSLMWKGAPVDCWVIEYQDQSGDFGAETLVRADDGRVLRQEARHGDEAWALERE